jgi:hypothetical protein
MLLTYLCHDQHRVCEWNALVDEYVEIHQHLDRNKHETPNQEQVVIVVLQSVRCQGCMLTEKLYTNSLFLSAKKIPPIGTNKAKRMATGMEGTITFAIPYTTKLESSADTLSTLTQ